MIITLVRHGEVDEAYHGCYNGHIDISLSQKGASQAKELAEHFKTKAFDAVYCSDLKRCRQTLAAFDLDINPVFTHALREKSWGRHEGKSFDEIVKSEGLKYENFEQWIEALDGEKYSSYLLNIENFFKGFILANPYENILIVTHAGVIRALMHLFQGISLQEAFNRPLAYADYLILNSETGEFIEKSKGLREIQCV